MEDEGGRAILHHIKMRKTAAGTGYSQGSRTLPSYLHTADPPKTPQGRGGSEGYCVEDVLLFCVICTPLCFT